MKQDQRCLGVPSLIPGDRDGAYAPGKAELLDLMVDAAYSGVPRTSTTGEPWRARVAAIAEDNRELFRTHPRTAIVSTLRPPLGPGQMAKYEHELAAFDDCGLDDVTADDCLTHLLTFVRANDQQAAFRRSWPSDPFHSAR